MLLISWDFQSVNAELREVFMAFTQHIRHMLANFG